MWCNPEDVRLVLGVEDEEVTDEKLEEFIKQAQVAVLDQISVEVSDKLDGVVNGVNREFKFHYKHIIDSDFDNEVDMKVYGVVNGEIVKEYPVSSINILNRTVVLSTAPRTDEAEVVIAKYRVTPNQVSKVRLTRATALLAAYYYSLAEFLLIPEQWFHGAYRFRFDKNFDKLFNEFLREIEGIIGKVDYVDKLSKIESYEDMVEGSTVESKNCS